MVVFTCQKCNSTLKKNAVEKHYSCRPFFLTCIDCLKDFKNNEYDAHKSCISEAQKYGGSNVKVKAHGVKQEKWVETAAEIISGISKNARYKPLCGHLNAVNNIPRNRRKFHNYLKSAVPSLYKPGIVDEIFDHLEKAKHKNPEQPVSDKSNNDELAKPSESNGTVDQNKAGDNFISNDANGLTKKKKKKNKRKNSENGDGDAVDGVVNGSQVNGKEKKKNKNDNHSSGDELKTSGAQQDEVTGRTEKKRKKKSFDTEKENDSSLNQATVSELDQGNKENSSEVNNEVNDRLSSLSEGKTNEKLSKRQLKKLKKQNKYLAEVSEIENQPGKVPVDSVNDITESKEAPDVETQKGKAKKKQKGKQIPVNGDDVTSKRKHADSVSEDIIDKKIKLNDTLQEETNPEQGKKFKWGKVIKQILENSDGKEMSLKKLRKKVFNEYSVHTDGEDVQLEKLLGTFNKKVNSTEGVKVHKDRAQLVVSS